MLIWGKGRYRTRLAETPEDLEAAQRLRYRAFIAGTGAAERPDGRDADAFDALCRHVLIKEARSDRLVATFRLMPLASGAEIGRCYSAQYYELEALKAFDGPMVEMGRFCIEPGVPSRAPTMSCVQPWKAHSATSPGAPRCRHGCASSTTPWKRSPGTWRSRHVAGWRDCCSCSPRRAHSGCSALQVSTHGRRQTTSRGP